MFNFIMNYIQESEPVHLVMQTVTVTVMLMSIVWLLFFGGKDSKWEGGLEFGESESTGTESGSAKDRCSACENPATKKLDLQDVQKQLATRPLWELSADNSRLVRQFEAKNFVAAQEFLAGVGEVAERLGHHPDLHLESYRNVRVEVYTFKVGGITAYDFELVDSIDEVKPIYSKRFKRDLDARLGS